MGPTTSGFPWNYLNTTIHNGILQAFDAVSVHPYRGSSPETVLSDYKQLREMMAAVKADQEPKEKTEEQVWDACASLDEKRAECAALMLEVSTSPMPETEGYCEKGTTFLDTIYKIRNQNTCTILVFDKIHHH